MTVGPYLRWGIVATLAAIATACGTSEAAPKLVGAPALGRPLARDFTLRDQAGRQVSLRDSRGRWVFLTFLYTHCPDVCPLTAEHLNNVLAQLPPKDRRSVSVLAVSVDPKGDTPAAVRRFVRAHRLRPEFRYLVGSRPQLERVWIDYNIVSTLKGAKRLFHSAITALIDPSGHVRLYYTPDTETGELHDLKALARDL